MVLKKNVIDCLSGRDKIGLIDTYISWVQSFWDYMFIQTADDLWVSIMPEM